MTSRFEDALTACIRQVPQGKVATCGAIARALGDVRAARAVAEFLRDHPDLDPRHQVVRADGHPVLPSSARGGDEARIAPERFVDDLEGVPLLAELRAEQRLLETQVREVDDAAGPRVLAGVDVAYRGDHAYAAAVLLDAESLEVLEVAKREMDVDFPYIPSYLAFREFPAVREVLSSLRGRPDLLFVDGHGRLHPALFGFACFAGVALNLPAIGIAKHPLAGTPVPLRRTETGAVPVEFQGAVRGYAWRPSGAARAFYISVGHRVSLETALVVAQRATRGRYPEPLVAADRISKQGKRKKNGERDAAGRFEKGRRPARHDSGA